MKALILTAMVLAAAIAPVVAQKKSTLIGDIVIGELTARDEATGEITIKYPSKEGTTEIFSGVLADGYKLRTDDGRVLNWKLNQITPGMRVRVFYKSTKVSGREKKINRISRLDFLGKDEYARLRNQLNVDPSTAVVLADKDNLPACSPLKIYPAIPYSNVHQYFVDSINKWNRKNGDSHGKLELVSDLDQADTLIVIARGADTSVVVLANLPAEVSGVSMRGGEWSHDTVYLVVKESAGLKVLWTSVVPVVSSQKRRPRQKLSRC